MSDKDMTKDQKDALLLWKSGLGNMGKYFNGENSMPEKKEVATADSWETEPMPDENVVLKTDIILPNEAMELVLMGHIPEAMEDHWFMYCDDKTIRYYRSWTGLCVFVANYTQEADGYRITSLTINRNKKQYNSDNNRRDFCLFMYLLLTEAGGNGSEFFSEYLSYD